MPDSFGVCHIISSFHPVVGGAERSTLSLCQALRERDLDAMVLTRRIPGTNPRECVGTVPVYRAGPPWRGKAGALGFGLHALWILAVRLSNCQVLHVQNIDTPLLVGMIAGRIFRRRVVMTVHGESMIQRRTRTAPGRLRVRLMTRLVDRFIAITPRVVLELRREGVPPTRIRLVPNGVDTDRFRPPTPEQRVGARSALRVRANELIVLFVGRLVELKGVDVLLEAWSRLPAQFDGRLLVVGDGAARASLERRTSELGRADIRFDGARESVVEHLHAADVFVLPSRQEGLSVALLEAMAAGVIPIVTDLPGNRAIVRSEHDGLIVPADDPTALHAALMRVVSDSALRRRLGKQARATVLGQYSLDAMAQECIDQYAALAA